MKINDDSAVYAADLVVEVRSQYNAVNLSSLSSKAIGFSLGFLRYDQHASTTLTNCRIEECGEAIDIFLRSFRKETFIGVEKISLNRSKRSGPP